MRRLNPMLVVIAILLLLMLGLAFCTPPMRFAGAQDDPMPCFDLPGEDALWHFCGIRFTYTPSPPVVTSTPTPYPTPTIEDSRTPTPTPLPTNNPSPTPTSTPVVEKCTGTVYRTEGDTLNVRAAPNTSSAIIGALDPGQTVTLENFADDENGDRWYGFYWEAIDDWAYTVGYSHGYYLALSGDCSGLVDATPEETIASLIVGLHPVPGAGREEIISFELALREAGIQSGVKPYHSVEYCIDALAMGATCVYRVPPDCPDRIGGDDPRVSAYEFMAYRDPIIQANFAPWVNSGRLWIELTNECNYDQHLNWWADWFDAALDYAEAHDWSPLAVGTPGPGHGSYHMFSAWQAVLVRNHAAGGLFAMHSYAPREICGGDGSLSACDPWCACRHRTNYDFVEVLGYDINITITEAAANWGNEQVNSANLQDNAVWIALIKDDEGLYSVYFWLVGYHPTWPLANLSGHLAEFATRIIATWD